MEVTLLDKKIIDDKIELDLEVPFQEITKKSQSILQEYSKLVALPGFRKGKVPENMVKKKFQKEIENETIDKIIPEATSAAIKTNQIETYGPPLMTSEEREKISYQDQESINFKVSYHRPPSCELKSLDKLEISDIKIKITDEDIENSTKDKLLSFAKKQDIDGDWELTDLLKINLTFSEEALNKYNLTEHPVRFQKPNLGATPPFLNQLFQELKSMKKTEVKNISFTFSKDTSEEDLKDKTLDIKLEITNVVRMILPEITPEVLEKLNCASKEELDKSIRDDLARYTKDREEMHRHEQILEAVRKQSDFIIPSIALDYILQEEWDQMLKQMFGGKMPDDVKLQRPNKQWVEENRPRARKQLEDQLVIQKVKESESIDVGEEEMTKEVETYANNAKQDVKEYRRELIKNGQYTHIKNNLIVKKTLQSLINKAKITDTKETTFLELTEKKRKNI